MTILSQFNSLRIRKPLLTYTLLFLLSIAILLLILRVSLPAIVKAGTVSWLKDHDVSATIQDVSFNFTNGNFILHNLVGKNTENHGFNIGQLELQWEWRPLSRRTLVIDGIMLDNFHVDVLQYADGKMNIAGLQLPFDQDPDTAPDKPDDVPGDAFDIDLKRIQLNKISACLKQFNTEKLSTLDMCFSLGEFDWTGDITYTIAAQVDGAELPLQVSGVLILNSVSATNNLTSNKILGVTAIKLGKIQVDTLASISIDTLSIKTAQAILDTGTSKKPDPQSVAFESLAIENITLDKMKTISISAVSFNKLESHIVIDGTDIPAQDYTASLANFDWQGKIAYTFIEAANSESIPLDINGNLVLSGFSARNNHFKRKLVEMASLQLNNLKIQTLDSIMFDNVTISQLKALQREGDLKSADLYIAAYDKLVIDTFSMNNMNRLDINTVSMEGLYAHLVIKPDGKFEYQEWVPASGQSGTAKPVTEAATDKPSFQYALGQLKLSSERNISFADNSLKEPFVFGLSDIDVQISNIDSSKPEQLSQLSLSAQFDKNTALKLDAKLSPLAERPDINGTGVISGLDLRKFAPLTKQYIGHSIRSGQLDSDITLKSDKGILDSKVVLVLNQFELRALNKKEADELNSELGFPLNTSLSLLRDKDNRIKLEIPVTGDINKPDFNPADALKQATTKAISTAVLYYYTPFGLVLAGNALLDLATALKFEPVIFPASQFQLNDAHKTELDKLASLLNERPGVHLTLCGISNKADTAALFPAAAKSTASPDAKEIVIDTAQTRALLELAEQRGNAVKDYLVGTKKIGASRLIVCEPEVRMSAEAPVVEISI